MSAKLNTSGLTICRPEFGSVTISKLPLGMIKEIIHTINMIKVSITKMWGISNPFFLDCAIVCTPLSTLMLRKPMDGAAGI